MFFSEITVERVPQAELPDKSNAEQVGSYPVTQVCPELGDADRARAMMQSVGMPTPSWLKGMTVTALGLSCACCDLAGPNDLMPALRVQPDTVVPGDTFHVRVTVRNPTFATVTLVSGYSCAVLPIILRDGEVQHLDGTDLGCLAVGREFPIAPRDSVFWDFRVVALLLGSKPRFAYVTPPPAGNYTVRGEMQVQLPDMEALLVVEPMPQHRHHRGGP